MQMANKHTKRYSTSKVIWKVHIKTIMRYHYAPTRMAKNQDADNTKILARMWSNRNSHSVLLGMPNGIVT